MTAALNLKDWHFVTAPLYGGGAKVARERVVWTADGWDGEQDRSYDGETFATYREAEKAVAALNAALVAPASVMGRAAA